MQKTIFLLASFIILTFNACGGGGGGSAGSAPISSGTSQTQKVTQDTSVELEQSLPPIPQIPSDD